MRKVRSNIDDAVIPLRIRRQEGSQGDPEGEGIDRHGAEGRLDTLLGEKRDIGQNMREAKSERDDSRDRSELLVR